VMQCALRALECSMRETCEDDYGNRLVAIVALRAELAKPEPEPVAWINASSDYCGVSRHDTVYGSHTIPLYRKEDV